MNEVITRLSRPVLGALLLVAAAACSRSAEPPPLQGARIGGPFELTDQNGRLVRDRDFAGRYRLIYFGYSFCPDICPTDLQAIGQALRQFEAKAPQRAAKVQPIFITLDPQRDSPHVLKPYVAAFHPRLIGLTGKPEAIAAVAKSFGVYGTRQPGETGSEYLLDHSRQAYLFGPEGEPIVLLPQDEGAKAVAESLERWVK